MFPPCIDLSPPLRQILKSPHPHVLNTCGKPCNARDFFQQTSRNFLRESSDIFICMRISAFKVGVHIVVLIIFTYFAQIKRLEWLCCVQTVCVLLKYYSVNERIKTYRTQLRNCLRCSLSPGEIIGHERYLIETNLLIPLF